MIFSKNCEKELIYRDISLKEKLDNLNVNSKNLNLSELELKLIYLYVGIDYEWINSDLKVYGLNRSECKNDVVKLINSGLNKISPYENKVVFRRETFQNPIKTKKFLKENVGKIIKRFAFFSTSKKNWNNSDLIFKIFTINNSSGRDLSEINIESPENEVLFKTNTNFKILKVSKNLIELQETLDEKENLIKWKKLHD
jgi:hypothetical protein